MKKGVSVFLIIGLGLMICLTLSAPLVSADSIGDYRVYAKFEDNFNNIIEDGWEFEVV